jgi:hypothetical protein
MPGSAFPGFTLFSCPKCHTQWQVEEGREARCSTCGGRGVPMSDAEAIASSQADLPAPDMTALLEEHRKRLEEEGRAG